MKGRKRSRRRSKARRRSKRRSRSRSKKRGKRERTSSSTSRSRSRSRKRKRESKRSRSRSRSFSRSRKVSKVTRNIVDVINEVLSGDLRTVRMTHVKRRLGRRLTKKEKQLVDDMFKSAMVAAEEEKKIVPQFNLPGIGPRPQITLPGSKTLLRSFKEPPVISRFLLSGPQAPARSAPVYRRMNHLGSSTFMRHGHQSRAIIPDFKQRCPICLEGVGDLCAPHEFPFECEHRRTMCKRCILNARISRCPMCRADRVPVHQTLSSFPIVDYDAMLEEIKRDDATSSSRNRNRQISRNDLTLGRKFLVKDKLGRYYPAEIIDVHGASVRVSFHGFASRWDEWIPTRQLERFRPHSD